MSLEGKTALVTGSSKGLGRAIVGKLASQGANVVINYSRDKAAADQVRDEVASKALTVRADVSNVDDIQRLFAEAVDEFGGIDIVVANAGREKVNIPVAEVTEEDFDQLFLINTKGPYFVLREAARRIADNGRIINISSNTTTVPQEGVGLYGTSKVASGYLVRVLALELGHRGVTANSIVPGPIDGAGIFTDPANDAYKRSLIDMVPIGRLGTARDVAEIAAFLASDAGGLITGQQIVADGGMH
ncbi:SDR family NAD(P)-dependent oxidoreductase [Fodinicola acaciae]|uniref:SDR family NAD(P)-dependent oxidoreductase n=1 Tax=Fodinicola acaciae TaxID=2681555 RepID=UPI0013D6E0BB|nr:SDR family oxidoreductase [Fodinicola acaciae]